MARLNARWSRFWATSKTYKHFWQSFPTDASNAGATLTVTTTLSTVGAANVSALGVTLTETISLIAGAANVTALGATLTLTSSVIAGVATGGATIAGDTVTATTSIIAGVATGGAVANGATITATTSVIAGVASIEQPGQTITVNTSLLEGHADVSADGTTITLDLTLIEGVADVSAEGQTLQVDLSLIDGAANVEADGVTQLLDLVLIEGYAFATDAGDAFAVGATITCQVSVIAGAATGETAFVRVAGGMPFGPSTPQRHRGIVNATAHGTMLVVTTNVMPGAATGVDNRKVVRERPVLSEIVPISQVHVTASGASVVRALMLEAGKASGDAIAYGQLVEGQWDWGPYDDDVMMLVLA